MWFLRDPALKAGTRRIEPLLLRIPRGAMSRLRLSVYSALGMRLGRRNRMEGGGRVRRCSQIAIGDYNAFTQGCWLWPEDTDFAGIRIRIGSGNYFNRNLMIDACASVEIGDFNMIGPDVYITDSNHRIANAFGPGELPMDKGKVVIGNRCWIGAKALILKDVVLDDGCVVAAGAVVTRSVGPGQIVAGVPARPIALNEMRQSRAGVEQFLSADESAIDRRQSPMPRHGVR
jgi:acetyltransferase-like isoleucine patch superfamily enzyme